VAAVTRNQASAFSTAAHLGRWMIRRSEQAIWFSLGIGISQVSRSTLRPRGSSAGVGSRDGLLQSVPDLADPESRGIETKRRH
jgi:hypothetical protein